MKLMMYLIAALIVYGTTAYAQKPRKNLYQCEGCEAIYEHTFENLTSRTTISADEGEPLVLSGTVYLPDGITPAKDVIIYAYHTNKDGIYPTRGDEKGWARRHGYLRGWVKTNGKGHYRFNTIRPGLYPNRNAAAHIHMTVKEPDYPEYWIEEVVFEDDPLVDATYRAQQEQRGGSGIIALTRDANGIWVGTRDIVLEIHPEGR